MAKYREHLFCAKAGAVRFYDALNNTVSTIGTLNVLHKMDVHEGKVEDGLVGIALDPNFKENHWIYLFYVTPMPEPSYFRISRFTLVNNQIDMGSEIILIDILSQQKQCCHTGGAMAFDDYGF